MLWLFRSGIVLFIYTGLTIYMGFRLFAFGRLLRPSLKRVVFWPGYIVLSYGFILFALFRLDRIGVFRLFEMYWPPFFICLFSIIVFLDLASLALFFARKITRRDTGFFALRLMPAGTGAALGLSLLLLVYGSFNARNIKTARYELTVPERTGTESSRIVLVSDLHIGSTVDTKWAARIVDQINSASPDMVCITGDIFDHGLEGVTDKEGIAAELGRISAPWGVYACLGNHDTNRQTRSTEEITRFLEETGMVPLLDRAVQVRLADETAAGIYVAGRRDARPIGGQSKRLSMRELATSIAAVQDGGTTPKPLVILLDHQPVELLQEAEAGIDLVLCGHTHRGQLFPGNFFTRVIYARAGGTHYGYWRKNNTQAVVTSGAGVWGPPVRIGTNSEIVILDLRF